MPCVRFRCAGFSLWIFIFRIGKHPQAKACATWRRAHMNMKKRTTLVAGLSVSAFAFVALFTCVLPARTLSVDALYERAKAEGSLVLYTGGPTAPWDAAVKEFSARYPGVAVSVTGGFSNVLDKKIDAQLADGKLAVDFAVFQTLQDFVRWKQQGVLLEFKPQGFDKIDPSFKDANGAFVAIQINAMPYAYNPTLVKPED